MEENEKLEDQTDLFEDSTGDDVEIEKEDAGASLMERPFDPTKINIETKTPSLDTLISRLKENEIQMDTTTYFQRQDDLWDSTKQSRLIESILIRFPLPAFFFDSSDDNCWLVVDGLQRLSSIRNFCVTKKLKLTNLEFLTQLNGKGWNDLSGDLKRVIKESQVVIYKIMPGTPTDVKFNIFKRINTGGLVLEPQEIRHALFQGKPSEFIAKLAVNESFIKATNGKIKAHRMLNRDFANRFLAFYMLGYENYMPDLDTYMSRAMAGIDEKTDEELARIEYDYSAALNLIHDVFKKEAFRKIYNSYKRLPPINKAIFDTLTAQIALLSDGERHQLKLQGEKLKKGLFELLRTDDYFFTSVTSSTGDKNRVTHRHSKVKELIFQIVK